MTQPVTDQIRQAMADAMLSVDPRDPETIHAAAHKVAGLAEALRIIETARSPQRHLNHGSRFEHV